MYGSESLVCSETTPGCDPDTCPGISCVESAPDCDGSECKPKTGNMVGPTADGVDYRMENTKSECDTFEETFTEVNGNYLLDPECNPWTDGGAGSLRVIIIPIVDEFGDGSSDDLGIQSFAVMYLEGYQNDMCKGNECEIQGRFIKNAITVQGLTGEYDPNAYIQLSKLAE
jgi:hypothetical protein